MIHYLTRVWKLRYFWSALVGMDLRARYRRSIIGVGWSLLHPIAMSVVLCVVFASVFNTDIRSFGTFILSGLMVWIYVTSTVMGGCGCFLASETYMRQHPAPLAIYSLRTTLGAGVHFLPGLGVVIALVWILKGFDNLLPLVSLLPTLCLFFVLGWSLATCMGVLNVIFQDTQHLADVALQMLFYLTPILYPADLLRGKNLGLFADYNPLSALLQLIREPVLEARFPTPHMYLTATLAVAAVAILAVAVLRRYERRLIFYL